jgi:hypothetical protein
MDDSPFFGYPAKWGYQNARKPTQSANICSFIQRLNLQNSTIMQVVAKIWHNAWPQKVNTLIWLTLNQGLPVGTWLQCMGILPTCKVCTEEALESPQHCLLSSVPSPNKLERPFITYGKNEERPMTSLFPGHSSCWVKLSSREKMTPRGLRVPCRRLLLHQTTTWHPSQFYPLLPLDGEMPKAFW